MIELLDRYDITTKTRTQSSDSAYLSDVMGLLTREKRYEITDSESLYNPFATNSRIKRNTWRNGDIYETENGQGVFLGAINDVGFESTDAGRSTIVNAREPFATMLDYTVEEGTLISDLTLASYYTVATGAKDATTITLTATGTPSDLATGDLISFGAYNVPRYAVVSATGTPTTSITIDRPLERAVASGVVRCIRPAVISGPKALKNAFSAAGLSRYLGGSFDTLDAYDIEQQFLLRVFVRIESKVKLSDHIRKVMDLTDLYFSVSPVGVINIFRGLGYNGANIRKHITTSEVISPCAITLERQNLFAGYDGLFVSSTNTDVQSGDADPVAVAQWGSRERWQPIDDKGASISEYSYLYASARAAEYFGQRKIDYNGSMRTRLKMRCKRAPTGTVKPYNFLLGDQVSLTYDMGGGKAFTSEPAIVVGYSYNRQDQYYEDLILELNTWDNQTQPIIDGDEDMRTVTTSATLTTTAGSTGSVYVAMDTTAVYFWKDYVTSAPTVDGVTYFATANGGETRWVKVSTAQESYAKISETQTSGTDGGTFTSGAWQTRTLNTEDNDADSIVSISSNQFTLAAGTYRIRASAPAFSVSVHRAKLYNVTDASDTILGQSSHADDSGNGSQSSSEVCGEFTIAGAKTFEIRHRSSASYTTLGFGRSLSAGVAEVYTVVELWKVA
jgi:hypothetical protein